MLPQHEPSDPFYPHPPLPLTSFHLSKRVEKKIYAEPSPDTYPSQLA